MTQEQFEKLIEFEAPITNAYKNSFLHLPASEFNKIAAIYDEIYEKPLTKSQRNCNTCRLNALKRLGMDYWNYKNKIEKNEETPNKPKSNVGRPRKIKV